MQITKRGRGMVLYPYYSDTETPVYKYSFFLSTVKLFQVGVFLKYLHYMLEKLKQCDIFANSIKGYYSFKRKGYQKCFKRRRYQ